MVTAEVKNWEFNLEWSTTWKDYLSTANRSFSLSCLCLTYVELSLQEIIKKYTSKSAPLAKYATCASVLNSLTWPTPQLSDYQALAKWDPSSFPLAEEISNQVKSSLFIHEVIGYSLAWCRESEYAAWTLVNGYALNHTTVSVHRLGTLDNIKKLNDFLQENGIKLNSEGGILKGLVLTF
jgi:hypothetical protein